MVDNYFVLVEYIYVWEHDCPCRCCKIALIHAFNDAALEGIE